MRPRRFASVDAALRSLTSHAPTVAVIEKREPAVPIKKSIAPDCLVCLDDGKQFKSLKLHLAALGMTPDAYRAKWGLPESRPMVAPNYAAHRSRLAKQMGLGQARKQESAKLSRKLQGKGRAVV